MEFTQLTHVFFICNCILYSQHETTMCMGYSYNKVDQTLYLSQWLPCVFQQLCFLGIFTPLHFVRHANNLLTSKHRWNKQPLDYIVFTLFERCFMLLIMLSWPQYLNTLSNTCIKLLTVFVNTQTKTVRAYEHFRHRWPIVPYLDLTQYIKIPGADPGKNLTVADFVWPPPPPLEHFWNPVNLKTVFNAFWEDIFVQKR